MILIKAFFIALFFSAGLLAGASPMEETFATSPMIYTGPITPGGKNVTLEGTAEQIYYQILELNPSYKPEDFMTASDSSALNANIKLAKSGKSHIICDPSGTLRAWRGRIQQGISFLKRVPQAGHCRVQGNRSCNRISCSWDSAIFLCNDNPYWIERPCPYLGDYAEEILRQCQSSVPKVSGQLFDTDNFNVLVKYDRC